MKARALIWPAAAVVALLAARRWLDVVEVRGRSMSPTLQPADRLLIVRVRPPVGAVAVAADPRAPGRELIKRVARTDGAGIHLRGDNSSASTDAREFGPVPVASVRWRAVWRYWPIDRTGRIHSTTMHRDPMDEGGEPACAVPEALIAG